MKKLSNTEAELKKSVAYKKSVYVVWFLVGLVSSVVEIKSDIQMIY